MGINMWCFTALIFLVSVKAEPYNYLSKSIYERLQSSTPSPVPAQSSSAETKGMKEIVLFLTPNQVESLQAAGAVVRPFDEYGSEMVGIQEKLQQNKPQYKIVKPNEDQNQLDNYYKLLNIQEINDDLANEQQATERAVEKTTTAPRNKYTKSRQQYKEKEYAYVPKKTSRTKTSNQNTNSEYVRFLPNYEKENLKMAPYNAVPLSPYQYVDVQVNVNTQANGEPRENDEAGANENAQGKDEAQANDNAGENFYTRGEEIQAYVYPQRGEEAQENSGENTDAQADNEGESDAEDDQSNTQARQKNGRPQGYGRIPVPVFTQKSLLGQKYFHAQKFAGQPPKKQQRRPETSTPAAEPTPVEEEEQFSRLLAPLYQHKAITDSIARQKEELLNDELEIRKKLQDIQKAPQHNDQEYATEVKNLAANLDKQNALSEIEAISKSPSAFVNQQNKQETDRRPIESANQRGVVKQPTPVLVRIQTPTGIKVQTQYPVPVDILRHIWEH